MVAIVVYQTLTNSALYRHECLDKINTLCKSTGIYDDEYQYKYIIEAVMI